MSRIHKADRLLRLPQALDNHLNVIKRFWKFKQQMIFVEETNYSSQISFHFVAHFRVPSDWMVKYFQKSRRILLLFQYIHVNRNSLHCTQACCLVNNPYLFWVLSIYGSNYIVPKSPVWRFLSSPRWHGTSPKIASLEQSELPATSLFGSTALAAWNKLLRNSLSYCFV